MEDKLFDTGKILQQFAEETRRMCDINSFEDFTLIDYLREKIDIDVEVKPNTYYKGFFYLNEKNINKDNIRECIEKYRFLLSIYEEYKNIRGRRVIDEISSLMDELNSD